MRAVLILLCAVFFTTTAQSSELRHQFRSPAFNGQGFSSHALTIENLTHNRKKELEAKAEADRKEAEREAKNTNVNKFLANVESRIYAELSKQISEKLFGENAQTSGTMELLGNTIEYQVDNSMVSLTVRESGGKITTLEIPVGQFTF